MIDRFSAFYGCDYAGRHPEEDAEKKRCERELECRYAADGKHPDNWRPGAVADTKVTAGCVAKPLTIPDGEWTVESHFVAQVPHRLGARRFASLLAEDELRRVARSEVRQAEGKQGESQPDGQD